MRAIFSAGLEAVAVSEELLQLLNSAYEHQGQPVDIPRAVVDNSGVSASAQTAGEINAIRRSERTVSTQTLSFCFA